MKRNLNFFMNKKNEGFPLKLGCIKTKLSVVKGAKYNGIQILSPAWLSRLCFTRVGF